MENHLNPQAVADEIERLVELREILTEAVRDANGQRVLSNLIVQLRAVLERITALGGEPAGQIDAAELIAAAESALREASSG